MHLSTDLDGDSEMLSSSGSASPVGARTPTFDKPAAELSPPGSQTASQHESFGVSSSFDKLAGGHAAGNGKPSSVAGAQIKEQPGASWNNQRAQEEYNRALESVVDKDFSLRMLCSPLLYLDSSRWTSSFSLC